MKNSSVNLDITVSGDGIIVGGGAASLQRYLTLSGGNLTVDATSNNTMTLNGGNITFVQNAASITANIYLSGSVNAFAVSGTVNATDVTASDGIRILGALSSSISSASGGTGLGYRNEDTLPALTQYSPNSAGLIIKGFSNTAVAGSTTSVGMSNGIILQDCGIAFSGTYLPFGQCNFANISIAGLLGTIFNPYATTASLILLTASTLDGAAGALYISARRMGSFDVSTAVTVSLGTVTFWYLIINPINRFI